MTCERKGCNRKARGDTFCSAYCARIHNGVQEAPKKKRSRYVSKVRQMGPPIIENEYRNLDRHEGPQVRQRPRLTG